MIKEIKFICNNVYELLSNNLKQLKFPLWFLYPWRLTKTKQLQHDSMAAKVNMTFVSQFEFQFKGLIAHYQVHFSPWLNSTLKTDHYVQYRAGISACASHIWWVLKAPSYIKQPLQSISQILHIITNYSIDST